MSIFWNILSSIISSINSISVKQVLTLQSRVRVDKTMYYLDLHSLGTFLSKFFSKLT